MRRAAPIAALAAGGAWLLCLSWLRWGDPVVESFRDPLAAAELARGAILYRDVRYLYGPLAPHLNAALARLFGDRLPVFYAAGLAAAFCIAFLLHRLARRLLAPWPAAAAVFAVLVLCGFQHYSWSGAFDFVLPYTSAATYGLAAALAALLLLIRHGENGRPRDLVFAGWSAAAALLAKNEMGLAALAACAAHAVLEARRGRPAARTWALAFGPPLLAAALVYENAAAAAGGWKAFASGHIFLPAMARSLFMSRLLGTDAPWANTVLLLHSCLLTSLVVGAALWSERLSPRPAVQAARGLALAALGWLAAEHLNIYDTHRWLVLLALGTALQGERDSRARFLLAVFALPLLARKLLAVDAANLGFVLLPPALLLEYDLFLARLPLAPAGRAGLAALLLSTLAVHGRVSAANFALQTVRLDTPRGTLLLREGLGRPFAEAAAYVLRAVPQDARLLILPEGAGLHYLTGRPRALTLDSFLPAEVTGEFADSRLAERLRAAPPDFVVVVDRPLYAFGVWTLGDYLPEVMRFVVEGYEPLRRWEAPPGSDPPFKMTLLRKRGG